MIETHERETPARSVPCARDPAAAGERADHHVLRHREARERLQDLERAGDAEVAEPIGSQTGHVGSGEAHRPGVRPDEAGDEIEERRLAGAVRPDQADDLPPADLERHVAIRVHAAEALRKAVHR